MPRARRGPSYAADCTRRSGHKDGHGDAGYEIHNGDGHLLVAYERDHDDAEVDGV